MKTSLLTLHFFIAVFCFPICAQTLDWHTDYQKMIGLSKKENKSVLLFFNGSDWSGKGMWMKHEVLDTPSFQEKVGDQFLCFEVDFPRHKALLESAAKQNTYLKNYFQVQEIPSLVLLNPQGKVIVQMGYLPENGEQLAEDLLKIVEEDEQLIQGLVHLENHSENLRKLYQLAQDLGREEAIERILEQGLHTEDPYFLLEKYRLLVQNGKMAEPEAALLRQKMMELDPSEFKEIHFTMALIDFQQLSQNNSCPDCAVEPLNQYLNCCGNLDKFNIWRIEMMMAQLYMEADQKEKALLHAEKALQAAPDKMHDEIAHSLDYIRYLNK